jgi:hypothetical protein
MIYKGNNQRWPEFHAWACLCRGLGVRTYLELGCGSTGWMRLYVGLNAVAIDLRPEGEGGCVDHIHGDSHDPAMLPRIIAMFDGPPDAVFIDADHTYQSARADFDLWHPAARLVVGFHDILMPGVASFWHEVAQSHPSIEILARDHASAEEWQRDHAHPDGRLDCGGIGVIFKERLP